MSDATLIPEIQLSEIKTIQNEAPNPIEITMPTDNSDQTHDSNKTESDNEKPQADTICLQILDMKDVDKCSPNVASKDFMVYEYFMGARKQNYPATTVWVQQMGGGGYEGGGGLDYDPQSRNSFLLLVFSIVFIMLAITAIFVILVFQIDSLRDFFEAHGMFMAIPAMVVVVGISYGIACSPCCRTVPCIIIILFVTVVAMSIITAYVTTRYDTQIVMYALIGTAGTVLLCMGLACSSYDFTSWTLYIMAIAMAFAIISLVIGITMLATGTHMPILQLILIFIGTIINVVVLIIELQMILGGRAIEMSEDDYALAAYLLYTSIIDIFLRCVQMLGIADSLM